MSEVSQKLEDYIEAIYVLKTKTKMPVRIKEIASFLKVNKTTVVAAVKKLKENLLVTQEHYGYILLTPEGEKTALVVYNKHSVLKKFLMEILDVSLEKAEEDACKMEHILSDETFSKIEEFLKKGKRSE